MWKAEVPCLCSCSNKIIIPLALAGLKPTTCGAPRWLSTISYPTRTRGIIVNYIILLCYTIHSFIHSFIHSVSQSVSQSFIQSFIHSFIHSVSQSVSKSVSQSVIHSFSQSVSQSVSQSLIHWFIHWFIHSFIHSFILSETVHFTELKFSYRKSKKFLSSFPFLFLFRLPDFATHSTIWTPETG